MTSPLSSQQPAVPLSTMPSSTPTPNAATSTARRTVDPSVYRPQGYHRLAGLMGPYQETAIFRRFGSLNMLNLLSLQAELLDLEEEFRVICQRDDELPPLGDIARTHSRSFHALRTASPPSAQYQKFVAIRAKLKEYNEALLAVSSLAQLPTPSRYQLDYLEKWLIRKNEGNGFLGSSDIDPWCALDDSAASAAQERLERDLVTMQPALRERDFFSEVLTESLLGWYHRFVGSKNKNLQPAHAIDDVSDDVFYSDSAVARVNTVLVSVLASALPILAIVALYYVHPMLRRIGTAVAFTVVFAFTLAAFTNARRLEIFATTAAFAAVQVVFIGSVPIGG